MCFRTMILALACVVAASCSVSSRSRMAVAEGEVGLSLPSDRQEEDPDDSTGVIVDSRPSVEEGPSIMNAIRDEDTGEMVATDVISASRVTARFRHVAERMGKVCLEFDVTVPSSMVQSRYQLRFQPSLLIMEDTLNLDRILVTGEKYRDAQLRGYQRYQDFLASIISDPSDLVHIRQLEIFLERYFPDTYAMKTDTSFVSDAVAENCFGVTQKDAYQHYRRHFLITRNERRKQNIGKMYDRYIPSPLVTEHIRLDTVIRSAAGTVIYRYKQDVSSRPFLKKIIATLDGEAYEAGTLVSVLRKPEDLTFYVSSLSTLCDDSPHYRTEIISRNVYDHTMALIDFEAGSHDIDTLLSDNASELARVRRCIVDMTSNPEYETDSIVIMACCSPEGTYSFNERLASLRSDAVRDLLAAQMDIDAGVFVTRPVPENWKMLETLIVHDSIMAPEDASSALKTIRSMRNPDETERLLSMQPGYRYMREKLYPRLRRVDMGFFLHRSGMVRDTVHTSILDTVYMNGVEALRNLDYKTAATLLRPYEDYNCALALVCAGYDRTAAELLDRLPPGDARTEYLSAVVLARLGHKAEALKYFGMCVSDEPSMLYRANLDPELSDIVNNFNINNQL